MEASVGHLYASTTEIDVVVKQLNTRLSASEYASWRRLLILVLDSQVDPIAR